MAHIQEWGNRACTWQVTASGKRKTRLRMIVGYSDGMRWLTINRVAVEKLFSWNFSSEIRFVSY
jgi:hypothetical protein